MAARGMVKKSTIPDDDPAWASPEDAGGMRIAGGVHVNDAGETVVT